MIKHIGCIILFLLDGNFKIRKENIQLLFLKAEYYKILMFPVTLIFPYIEAMLLQSVSKIYVIIIRVSSIGFPRCPFRSDFLTEYFM
jgi:hypothetical protein